MRSTQRSIHIAAPMHVFPNSAHFRSASYTSSTRFRAYFLSTHSVINQQATMVQTRAQERGVPLKKEGAYNTDAYYQELDQGFGDVGVDQEPDAARTQADDKSDPDFGVSKDEMRAADNAAAEDPAADVPLKEDIADLQAGSAEDVNTTAKDGTPVGIVETSREEVEGQEAFTVPDKA